jgi:hypothetical protein
MRKITSTFKTKGSRRHQKQKDRRFFESQIDINNTLTPQREITNKVPDLKKYQMTFCDECNGLGKVFNKGNLFTKLVAKK